MSIIRRAVRADNAALVALARKTPMGGTISVRVDRDPDFFRMIEARGGGTVLVACDGPKIVGTISCSTRLFVFSGRFTKVAFVADFRVHPDLKGRGVALRLCRAMGEHLRKEGPELVTALIAAGNHRAMAFLQGRMKLPKFTDLGKFTAYQLFPSPRKVNGGLYKIRLAQANDIAHVQNLRHQFNNSYAGCSIADLRSETTRAMQGHDQERVQNLVAVKDGKIVAVLGLHDANDLKQIVIIRLPWLLKIMTSILRWASRYFPIPRFPRIGEAVRIMYLRHLAYSKGHEQAAKILIRSARRIAYKKECLFAMIGFHEKDDAKKLVRGIPRFKFESQGFMTSTQDQGGLPEGMGTDPLVEDFSLV